jgi:hypothetical protein
MIYNWSKAVGLIALGSIGLSMLRHYDRLDPFSPDFPWTDKTD